MITTRKATALLASTLLALTLAATPAWGAATSPPDEAVEALESLEVTEDGVTAGSTPEPVGVDMLTPDNLRTLQEGGEACSPTEGAEYVACVEYVDDPDTSVLDAGPTAPSTKAMVTMPSWCLNPDVMNQYRITRTAQCGIFQGVLTLRQVVNGQPTGPVTGTMTFLMYHYIYTLVDETTWGNQIIVSPTAVTGNAGGTQISGTASCSGSCVLQSQSFPVQTPGLHQNANGESYYKWNGTAGQVGSGTPRWSLTLKAPAASAPASLARIAAVDVRCDNAVPGYSRAGCVIAAAVPWVQYAGSVFVEFGAHVSAAQASGLPGPRAGVPLHRTTDPAIRDANRATACPASVPRPLNRDCDEYPFASTIEGAFSGGGTARVPLAWCQFPLNQPPSTGPVGYSVCMIDRAENQQAGSLLNSVLFVPNRVIDGDAFNVDIVY